MKIAKPTLFCSTASSGSQGPRRVIEKPWAALNELACQIWPPGQTLDMPDLRQAVEPDQAASVEGSSLLKSNFALAARKSKFSST